MYRLDREDFVKSPYISLWGMLGFQAGFINAFGFLACGRYVSHVTGVGSQIGVAVAERNLFLAVELLGFPLAFIFGSFFSGFFTSARLEQGKKPRYDFITFFLPVVIAGLLVFGSMGLFGPFGEQLILFRDIVLLYLLSFVCGMQNGCFATLTKGQIRTTHLTGISTDIGTDLARILFGRLNAAELELTKRTNLSRIVTFASFSVGSIVSVMCSQHFQYAALIVPLASSLAAFFAIRKIGYLLDLRFGPKVTKSFVTGGEKLHTA